VLNSDFHHNVFYNLDFSRGAVFIGLVSDNLLESGKSRVYNNIFYKVKDVELSGEGYTPGIIIHDYNDYYDCSGRMPTGPNDHVYTGIDPFINSIQFDFRLKTPTEPGIVLPSPYDIDYAGIIRGADGNWDRGAYEYVSIGPYLAVKSPLGGETWVQGFTHDITWSSSGVTEPIKIELFKASTLQWDVTVPVESGTSEWQIPTNQAVGSDYNITITAGAYSDTSETFTIATPAAPIVQTLAAQSVTTSSASLRGTIHPMGLVTTYHFEYGLDTKYGIETTEGTLAAGDVEKAMQASIAELSASTTYHFRLRATNAFGTSYGDDLTFTTASNSGSGSDESGGGGGGGGGCFIDTAALNYGHWPVLPVLLLLYTILTEFNILVNKGAQRKEHRA
jgi:hypothetical protein